MVMAQPLFVLCYLLCAHACVCVRACVRACVCVRVRARVCVCGTHVKYLLIVSPGNALQLNLTTTFGFRVEKCRF